MMQASWFAWSVCRRSVLFLVGVLLGVMASNLSENCWEAKDDFEVFMGLPGHRQGRLEADCTLECIKCGRKAEVFLTELAAEKPIRDGQKVLLMSFQANGLQPEYDFLRFTTCFVAIDLDGNQSDAFEITFAGSVAACAQSIKLDFGEEVPYARAINEISILFERSGV